MYSIFFVLLHRSPGRSSPNFQLLVMNPGFFISCRKGTKNPLKLTFPLSFLFPCKSTPFWIPHQVNNHQLLHTNTQTPSANRSCHPALRCGTQSPRPSASVSIVIPQKCGIQKPSPMRPSQSQMHRLPVSTVHVIPHPLYNVIPQKCGIQKHRTIASVSIANAQPPSANRSCHPALPL